MYRLIVASLLSMTFAVPAYAEDLSSGCDAADTNCLKNFAVQAIVDELEENDSESHSAPGAQYFELAGFLDMPEDDAARLAFDRAGASEVFWGMYYKLSDERDARAWMGYEGVEDGIMGRGYPEGVRWNDFIFDAIAQTINSADADRLVDLYLKETALFTKHAKRPSGMIVGYMARTQIDRLEQFGADPTTPEDALPSNLDAISDAAVQTCLAGDISLGKRIMALHDTHARTQEYSEELAFLPLTSQFRYILACEGEAQATVEFARIEEGLEKLPKGKMIIYDGMRISVDRFRLDVIMDRVVRPLAYHLSDTGRENEARALFSRYVAPILEIGIDPTTNTIITAMNALEHPAYAAISAADRAILAEKVQKSLDYEWDRELESRDEQDIYSDDASVRMDYFTSRFDPKFENCCTDGDYLDDMIGEIAAASRAGPIVPPKTIARALELTERAQAADQAPGKFLPSVLARLATIERSRGCALPEARLNTLLSEIESIEDDRWRFKGVVAMIEYNVTPLGSRLNDAPCIIQ